jgi:Response regulator containing a CheY-like receiver domain and an HTH DNA-binding domain
MGVVGAEQPVETRDVVAAVFSASARASTIIDALRAAGFEVATATCITCIADDSSLDGPFVAIVEDRDRLWLRQVSDLLRLRPGARVLALADVHSPEEFLAAVSAGVTGFVSPDADVDAIVRTVEDLRERGAAIPRQLVPALVDVVRHGRGRSIRTAAGRVEVTDREWEILELLVQGRTTREMADTLFISVGTVRSHVSALLKKLGAVDREDAVRLLERGRR